MVLAGETEAFAGIIRRFQREVWRVVAAGLHDVETTEDLVQQAFVNAYSHLDRYRRGEDFGPWIKAIARNLLRQELRRRGRENRGLDRYREHMRRSLTHETAHERRATEVAEALENCREQLPPRAARILHDRYARNRSFEQIARSLDRSVEATRQFLYRVRLQLRDCIERVLAEE